MYPHEGNWREGKAYERPLEFSNPLRVAEFGKQEGVLPLEKSFLELEGEGLVLSTVKKCDDRDSIVIRLFNPTEKAIDGRIKTGFAVKEAYLLRLDEKREGRLPVAAGCINISIIPGRIYTLEAVR